MRPHIDPLDIITISTVILGLTGFASWRVFRPEKRFRVPETWDDCRTWEMAEMVPTRETRGGGSCFGQAPITQQSHNQDPVSHSGSVGSV